MFCFIPESVIHVYCVRLERKIRKNKNNTLVTLETNITLHVNNWNLSKN